MEWNNTDIHFSNLPINKTKTSILYSFFRNYNIPILLIIYAELLQKNFCKVFMSLVNNRYLTTTIHVNNSC